MKTKKNFFSIFKKRIFNQENTTVKVGGKRPKNRIEERKREAKQEKEEKKERV